MKSNQEQIYDDYFICPKCGNNNIITKKQYLGSSICECKTICNNCHHEDYWAYGYYHSKFYTSYL